MITFWLDGHALARLDNGRWHTRCDATLPDSDRITDQQPADPCTRCSADIARRAEAALELERARAILTPARRQEAR